MYVRLFSEELSPMSVYYSGVGSYQRLDIRFPSGDEVNMNEGFILENKFKSESLFDMVYLYASLQ